MAHMSAHLGQACRNGDARRVTALLAAGHPPDEPLDSIGTTPLMTASNLDVVDILLTAGASLTPTRFGHDALQVAVSDDESSIEDPVERLAAARRLVEAGASLDLRNEHGWSRVYVAAFASDVGAVLALLALGAPADDRPPPLAAACWGSGSPKTEPIIDALVAAGADVHARDDAGWSLLHAAAMPYSHGFGFESSDGASVAAMRALVRHGVTPDVVGPGGTTALMLVAEDGDVEATAALLALGADPGIRDAGGRRAVDLARNSEHHLAEILATASVDTADAVRRSRERARMCIDLLGAP